MFRREVCDLAASLPYASSSFTRMIYLEFVNEIVNHVSKKLFCSTFLDAYYMLSKDKCANVLIKFCKVAPNVFRKASFEDAKNKERMVNVIRGLIESEKVKPVVREFAQEGLERILGSGILSSSQKQARDEEEKKFLEEEKELARDKFDPYKEKRTPPNGASKATGYESVKFPGSRTAVGDTKTGIPKTTSQSKLKKAVVKKKPAKKDDATPKTKAKVKTKVEKPKKK